MSATTEQKDKKKETRKIKHKLWAEKNKEPIRLRRQKYY